jgi:hypothetical protein
MVAYPTVSYPTGRSKVYNLGPGLHDLTDLLNGNGLTSSTLSARASGTRANATPLNAAVNLIAVCATANDSVALPPAVGGQVMWVANAGAASAQVYAAPGTADTINGIAAGTGVPLLNGKSDVFMSPLAGAWFTVASA